MTTLQTAANPFLLMMNPEVVFAAMARSDRLGRLASRVCRPLDKPTIVRANVDEALEDEAVDALIDDSLDE